MGESSPKSMRGAGMDDVIFAGTALRPARDFAEVSLLVEREAGDTGGDVAIAPVGEVEITRRIERGAGSAYRVNGRDVRAEGRRLAVRRRRDRRASARRWSARARSAR